MYNSKNGRMQMRKRRSKKRRVDKMMSSGNNMSSVGLLGALPSSKAATKTKSLSSIVWRSWGVWKWVDGSVQVHINLRAEFQFFPRVATRLHQPYRLQAKF